MTAPDGGIVIKRVPNGHRLDERVAKTRERLAAQEGIYISSAMGLDDVKWDELIQVEDDGSAWLWMGIDSVNAILDEIAAAERR